VGGHVREIPIFKGPFLKTSMIPARVRMGCIFGLIFGGRRFAPKARESPVSTGFAAFSTTPGAFCPQSAFGPRILERNEDLAHLGAVDHLVAEKAQILPRRSQCFQRSGRFRVYPPMKVIFRLKYACLFIPFLLAVRLRCVLSECEPVQLTF
jgi:hypothetical protein